MATGGAWGTKLETFFCSVHNLLVDRSGTNYKGTPIPLQAWTGLEGPRRMRLPDFKTIAHEYGKVVSPTHRPPLTPGNIPGTHFC
jgi:hypothetical protein